VSTTQQRIFAFVAKLAQARILQTRFSLKAGTASFACKYILIVITYLIYLYLSQAKQSKARAFYAGNVTSHRRHLVR
jgi:hypothetical protein